MPNGVPLRRDEVYTVAKPQPAHIDIPMPDPTRIEALAGNAVKALRTAREEISVQYAEVERLRGDLNADRGDLDDLRTELQRQQQNLRQQQQGYEDQLAEMGQRSFALEQQRSEAAADRAQLEATHAQLDTDVHQLEEQRNTLDRERQEHVSVVEQSARQARDAQEAQAQVSLKTKECDVKMRGLAQREEVLAKHEGELESQMSEFEHTRGMLTQMHTQLAREQKEVALQREELLGRLGAVSGAHAPADSSRKSSAVQVDSATVEKSDEQTKNASVLDTAAKQFRKLRRDAKRRVIGA